jgi:uncharacterized delta-60 repeat protein
MTAVWAMLLLAVAPLRMMAQFWEVDPGFTTKLEAPFDLDRQVAAMVRQPDGKVIIAGLFDRINGVAPATAPGLVRLNADGSTDTTFNATTGGYAMALYLQPSGKIVTNAGLRLNADGSVDTTFNADGAIKSVATLDATGRIYGRRADGTVARFSADGVEDSTFRPSQATVSGGRLVAFADGTVAVGTGGTGTGIIGAVRLKADGSPDPAFVLSSKNLPTKMLDMLALPDGRLLIYGTRTAQYGVAMQFVRITTTGAVDYNYIAPSSNSSAPGQADAFILGGVLYDLLHDAKATAGATVQGTISFNLEATANVAAGDTLVLATTQWGHGSTFARYRRVATGDLTIDPRPTITLQYQPPAPGAPPVSFQMGDSLVLTGTAGGLYPLNVQWTLDDKPIVGATQEVYWNHSLQGTDAGTYAFTVTNAYGTATSKPVTVTVDTTPRPVVVTQPMTNVFAAPGQSVVLSVGAKANPNPTFAWTFNGKSIPYTWGSDYSNVRIDNVSAANAGVYQVKITSGDSVTTQTAILGINTPDKVSGFGREVAQDIVHPNGNVYDQVLLEGAAATIKADAGQITRLSYVDLSDDIVQVEFSGAGSLTLRLDNASGPAEAVNYQQPGVRYMKGHGSIVITAADETTHVAVFTVGRANAVNQSLFTEGVDYDGVADVGSLAIVSNNGKFGGLRSGDASYTATEGMAGVYAPAVEFTAPVYINDVNASGTATPALVFGSVADIAITGGDLAQDNGAPVHVGGIAALRFTAGTTSQGDTLPAAVTPARFVRESDGADITDQILVGTPTQ